MKETLFGIAIACWMVLEFAAAADSYRFHPQSLRLGHAIEDILVTHGKCKRRELCGNEQILFVTSETWGLSLELYALDDKDALRQVLRAISDVIARKQDRTGATTPHALAMTKQTNSIYGHLEKSSHD